MSGWGWDDVASLAGPIAVTVLDRLEADAENDRRNNRPQDPERAAAIRKLRSTLKRDRIPENGAEKPLRSRWTRGHDVGDLYEWGSRCTRDGDAVVLVLVGDPIESVNAASSTHHQAIGAMEKRWTSRAIQVINESAVDPLPTGPVIVTFWHLRKRGEGRNLLDADNRHHAQKGVLDAFHRVGLIEGDGPGQVRGILSVESAYSDHDALIVRLAPAPPYPRPPIVTVPHHRASGVDAPLP